MANWFLKTFLKNANIEYLIIRTLLCKLPIVMSLSVRLSVCPFEITFPEQILSSLGLIWLICQPQSAYWWMVCSILELIFMIKCEGHSEFCKKYSCLDHIFSPLGVIWLMLHTQSAFGQKLCCDLNNVLGQRVNVIWDHIKYLFSEHIHFSKSPIWLILHINIFWGVKGMQRP